MPTVKHIAAQFPEWSLSQCRAYRDGAWAGVRGTTIREGFVYEPAEDDDLEDDLTPFYYRGYADALGASAEGEDWFSEIAEWRIVERWWDSD